MRAKKRGGRKAPPLLKPDVKNRESACDSRGSRPTYPGAVPSREVVVERSHPSNAIQAAFRIRYGIARCASRSGDLIPSERSHGEIIGGGSVRRDRTRDQGGDGCSDISLVSRVPGVQDGADFDVERTDGGDN